MTKTSHAKPGTAGNLPFAIAFVVVALVLLSQLGSETKFSAKGNLFAQPRFWPGVSVLGMVLFGTAHLAMVWRKKAEGHRREALIWLRAAEYVVWFMAYVLAVPAIGYLGATILFTALLALRQGYRKARQVGTAIAIGIAVVLIFKTGLAVKIPGGAIYEYLPGGLRNFMIVNF